MCGGCGQHGVMECGVCVEGVYDGVLSVCVYVLKGVTVDEVV